MHSILSSRAAGCVDDLQQVVQLLPAAARGDLAPGAGAGNCAAGQSDRVSLDDASFVAGDAAPAIQLNDARKLTPLAVGWCLIHRFRPCVFLVINRPAQNPFFVDAMHSSGESHEPFRDNFRTTIRSACREPALYRDDALGSSWQSEPPSSPRSPAQSLAILSLEWVQI